MGVSKKHMNRADVRKSHPGLYHSIMTLGLMNVALALNFWFSRPTFNPYGWDKDIIGTIFFLLGASQVVFLNVIRDLRVTRVLLATSISFLLFWGLSNSQQFFAGKSSLQLPLLYVALSVLQIPLLVEAPVNPMTEKK